MNNTEKNNSANIALNDSLKMLKETLNYLKRMPAVPVTLQMARKIEAFLNSLEINSDQKIDNNNGADFEFGSKLRYGESYSYSGLPLLSLQVKGDIASLSFSESFLSLVNFSEDKKEREAMIKTLIRQIENGVEIKLHERS